MLSQNAIYTTGKSQKFCGFVGIIRVMTVTYLGLRWSGVIVTIWCGTKGSSWSGRKVTASKTSALCKVVLALGLANLDLLLLAAATKLLWLEGALSLEVGAAMLWDETLRHGCGCSE